MKKIYVTTFAWVFLLIIQGVQALYGQSDWDHNIVIDHQVLDPNSMPKTISIPIPQTTTTHRVGAGTSFPNGRLHVSGCLGQSDLATLLIHRPYCGSMAGSGLPNTDGIIAEGGGGNPFQRVAITNISLPDMTTATQMFSNFGKPLILTKLDGSNLLGMATTSRTPFLVDANGYLGVNVERPRASADFCGLGLNLNNPSMIVGVRSQPQSNYTRHVHFSPIVGAMGWNSISQSGDHGMFFTDGLGSDGSNQNAGLVIAPWADNLFTGGLRMDNMGNVELRGDLRATKVTVDAVWWPDFVFAKDYSLMPLQQVKAFIELNKRLPEMPSEAEVKENGQDMGELQKLQQQKIEELTLYTIDQEEKIKMLEDKLQQLELLIESLLD